MRVLLITDWLAAHGGVEAYTSWLRAGLQAAGDDVRLLTSSAGSADSGSADFVAWGTNHVAAQTVLQVVNPFAMARVREAVLLFHPDVALVNMFTLHLSPAIMRPLRDVPTVISLHEYKVICPIGSKLLPDGKLCTQRAGLVCWRNGCVGSLHWLRDQARYAMIRSALGEAARILACSAWLKGELAANEIQAQHVVLPVPAPRDSFRRVPGGHPTFVFCGGLRVEKGVSLLLRAFARLHAEMPSARLRIVGDGAQRWNLERLCTELGLANAVTFMGQLSPLAVEQQLVDAWALVAPSLWAEPLGLSALEAIVRGVPVIASSAGGFSETVEPGVSGLLFPNGDENALLVHLRAIASGRAFPTHSLDADVVGRVTEKHRIDRHIARIRAIFAELAPQNRASASVLE
ncbi:MAG: glycosyltransferase family 4 protein [Tepidisphaeraceae bacterium]